MHSLAQRLLSHIRRDELLNPGDRVGVAVSGGIDSIALLRLLLELRFELGIVLSVVHFNHKLRGAESDADEDFVRNLAGEHSLASYADRADVDAHAREAGVSLETAARDLRYGFFRSLIRPEDRLHEVKDPGAEQGWNEKARHGSAGNAVTGHSESRQGRRQHAPRLDKVATGHTLDDQAETVLMRMIRGAGMRGLGAIYPRIQVEDHNGDHSGEIVRPLLETRRCELKGYLKDIDQSWREDSSNAEHRFTRNRVRKLLVPLLEKEFNPKIAEGLAELAEIARKEEDYWENEVAGWMGTGVHWSQPEWMESQNPQFIQIQPAACEKASTGLQSKLGPSAMNASLDRLWFLGEPVAVQRRLIKAIAQHAGIPLEFKHVGEIMRFASENGPSGKRLPLPLGWKLLRESTELLFLMPDPGQQGGSEDYEYSLPVPGRIVVREVKSAFEAQILEPHEVSGHALDALLDVESLPGPLTLRNWHAGDRFQPAHTKSAKKLKDLLTDLHVAHADRANWPIVARDEIVWVRGFPVPSKYRAKAGQRALLIRELSLRESA